MYTLIKISILISILGYIKSTYLEAESNYRPKLERNNILNKGLWVKKHSEIKNTGDFIFKTNSFDVDNIHQDNIYNEVDDPTYPFFSSYIQRNKRDTKASKIPYRINAEHLTTKENENEIKPTLQPVTVSNDPYKVAGLVSHTDHYNIIHNIPPYPYTPSEDIHIKYGTANISQEFDKIMKPLIKKTQNFPTGMKNNAMYYSTNDIILNPTNMSRSSYESQLIKKIEINEEFNDTINKGYKNIFHNHWPWQQSAPVNNIKTYRFQEKPHQNTNVSSSKRISEKGLLKVLAMLTRTFKRIMKQHNDIKLIHNKLHNLNSDFMYNLEIFTKKFEDFDNKYNQIMKINEKLVKKENDLKEKQQSILNKERELSNNLIEFGKQQRKFLIQQSQFYNIQKQMLAQNEKISSRQAQIAKTQNEISNKQYDFARILSKDNPISPTTYYPKENIPENPNIVTTEAEYKTMVTSTPQTESIKINLFSISEPKELKNYDMDMLKEKDKQPIDDLIYKYYFNNTFVDDIIKNKILANVINMDSNHKSRKRRPRKSDKNTLLFPVNSFDGQKHRERRWIRIAKKKNHRNKNKNSTPLPKNIHILKETNKEKPNTDPFMKMAMTFCTEIDQNQSIQAFNWCVEKALRRLQVIDLKMATTPRGLRKFEAKNESDLSFTFTINSTDNKETTTAIVSTLSELVNTDSSKAKYFPDNDDLESNLKQYDLKPDTEGDVYFEGSLHASDLDNIDAKEHASDGFSDIIPGLDSNSKVELSSTAIEMQAQRRAEVRRSTIRPLQDAQVTRRSETSVAQKKHGRKQFTFSVSNVLSYSF